VVKKLSEIFNLCKQTYRLQGKILPSRFAGFKSYVGVAAAN
jgi:hypothetical protein